MKTITQYTHFEDERNVVLADGSFAHVEFKKAPTYKRDPLVRVYMKASNCLVHIASGRLSKSGDIAIVAFIAGNEIPDIIDVRHLGNSLTQVTPNLYNLIAMGVTSG